MGNIFFLLACLLCGLPVWLPHFPPMVDLPQHAAQVSLFLNLGKPDFPFAEQFQLNLFTPYLFGYSLIAVVTPLLGIVAACKLVIWLALAAFPLASRFFLRQAGADPYWAWLTFPVLYGFAYQWGLLNFLVAAPIGLLFLGLVWRQKAQPDWRSSLLITLLLYALFFSHILILAFFGLIAVAYWLLSASRLRDFIKCAWPIIALVPIVFVWVFMVNKHPLTNLSSIQWDLSWTNTLNGYYLTKGDDPAAPGWGRVTGFIPRLLGIYPNLILTLLGVMLFTLPLLAGGRIARSRMRFIPLLTITLTLLLLPSFLFGFALIFQRFTYLAMPLFLVTIDATPNSGRATQYLRLIAPVIAFGWIGYASNNALLFNKDEEGFEAIIAQMEPGQRSRSLIFLRDDSHSIAPTFLHFPAWYSAIKSGITDVSFSASGGPNMPLIYKPEYIPKNEYKNFVWAPQRFNWQAHEGYKYDYFVVRAPVDMGDALFRNATCRIDLMTHLGQWWLYRRAVPC